MKRIIACAGLAVALLAPTVVFGQDAAAKKEEMPQYVGVEGCKLCHRSERTGDQFGKWEASAHAKAYATLATPKAKEIAKAKGIADPQKAPQCLKCHVTQPKAEEIAEPVRGKQFHMEDGVQCETCHGPGSLYKSRSVMKDKDAAMAKGLRLPDEAFCKTCHNDQSPTFTGFDFKEKYAKIAHEDPMLHPDEGEGK
jgi:hypothetical protein